MSCTGATTWEVRIQGRASDLAHLARYFTGPEITVRKDERDNCYLLQLASFSALLDSNAVLNAAQESLPVLSGVLKLVRNSDEPLRADGAVYRRAPDGRRDVFMHIQETLKIKVEMGDVELRVTDAQGVVREVAPPPRSVAAARLAFADAAVARVLRLLATDAEDWVGLYRLHEVIEADVGGEHEMVKHGWGSARQLKRFKHSANSVTVAGDGARHGKEAHPPTDPMALDEAKAYVAYVVQAWLQLKGV